MIRWQVDIGNPIPIPFPRGVYNVCVTGLVVTKADPIPKIVYIVSRPSCEGTKLWIGGSSKIPALKCFINNVVDGVFSKKIERSDVEYFIVNFMEWSNFTIQLINEKGVKIRCSGYCILELHEMES